MANNHPGFTGTGFVDYANMAGSFVQFSVNRSAAGTVKLTFRYANGSTANRPTNLIVNGATVTTIPFAPTGAWTTWSCASVASGSTTTS